jgi:hypothetical protein
MQAQCWVRVDGVLGRRIGSIRVNWLIGATSYDENCTLCSDSIPWFHIIHAYSGYLKEDLTVVWIR